MKNYRIGNISYLTEDKDFTYFGISQKLFNETFTRHFKVSKEKEKTKEQAIYKVNIFRDYDLLTFDDSEFQTIESIQEHILKLI